MTTYTARFGQTVLTGHDAAPSRWAAGLREFWTRYRAYRETVAQLEALSDRELADIGMERLALRRIARAATLGK